MGAVGRLLAIVLAGGLLPACSGSSINVGPFGGAGTLGLECAPVAPGQVISYGAEEFPNTGPPAVIDKVALYHPHNLVILAAYAIPITGHSLYGILSGYPPARQLAPGVHWSQRQRADGAWIPHSRGTDVTNILLVLKPTSKIGTALGLDVFYRAAGQNYHLRTATQVMITVTKSCPANPSFLPTPS